jgi:hypothetical protein
MCVLQLTSHKRPNQPTRISCDRECQG